MVVIFHILHENINLNILSNTSSKKMTKEIKQKKSLHLNMLQFKYSQWQTDLVFLIDDSALWSIKKNMI